MVLYISADGCLGNQKHTDDGETGKKQDNRLKMGQLYAVNRTIWWYFKITDLSFCFTVKED